MRFELNGRTKRIIVTVTVLSIIFAVFVAIRSYMANVSQQALIQKEQEIKTKLDQEAKAKLDQEAKAKLDQEAKAKLDQEAKAKLDQEAKTKLDQEDKVKADQEVKNSNSEAVSSSSAKTQIVDLKGFKNPIFANSSQIILVTANGMSTSYGKGSIYEKTNGEWKKLSGFDVRLGVNGMSYTRAQNSDKTPAGVLNISSAFGIAENPGANYTYHKVTVNDYWDLNSGSPTYNRMINSNVGGDLEHLIDFQMQYKYVLVTDWNYSQNPDKGGAIFIHVNGEGATGSCISLSEGNMISLMKWINPNKNPKILVVPNSDLGNYFY